MKTLITGATGFVGAAVLRQLLKNGHKVKALVRKSSVLQNLKGLDVEIVYGDLLDKDSLLKCLKNCKYLFHVAADYRLWVPKPKEIYENNVTGTENLMHEALKLGIEKIIYTSSVAVLGKPLEGDVADENTPVNLSQMIGHYKKSKFLAEEKVKEEEEEQVQRQEDPVDADDEQEHEGEEPLHALLEVPHRQHAGEKDDGVQHDENGAEAIHPQVIGDADVGDPGNQLYELHAACHWVVVQPQLHAQDAGEEAGQGTDPAYQPRGSGWCTQHQAQGER